MKGINYPTNTLIYKNVPKEITNFAEFLQALEIPAKFVKPFGRRRVLITYEHNNDMEKALELLNGLEINGKQCHVAMFLKDKPLKPQLLQDEQEQPETHFKAKLNHDKETLTTKIAPIVSAPKRIVKIHKAVQTIIDNNDQLMTAKATTTPFKINKYVRSLYALDKDLDFQQPPPPHLKYNYPPINADIVNGITQALLHNTKFYIQVLHLMNRMNLEPPFGKCQMITTNRSQPFSVYYKGGKHQIDKCMQTNTSASASDKESELESNAEDKLKTPQPTPIHRLTGIKKRMIPISEQEPYKKKLKTILNVTKKQSKQYKHSTPSLGADVKPLSLPQASQLVIKKMFEKSANQTKTKTITKIEIKLKPKANEEEEAVTMSSSSCISEESIMLPPLKCLVQKNVIRKFSVKELENLAIYKNYEKGTRNHKLYIKNLHKNVAISDLLNIYKIYVNDVNDLDIKVMQHGRMKGQAFVSFHEKYSLDAIEKALNDTNGCILLDKAMVVCYGKHVTS